MANTNCTACNVVYNVLQACPLVEIDAFSSDPSEVIWNQIMAIASCTPWFLGAYYILNMALNWSNIPQRNVGLQIITYLALSEGILKNIL